MVKLLTRVAEHYGCTIEATPAPLNQEHGISVCIRRDPAFVGISLDGNSALHRMTKYRQHGGAYLGHWNIELRDRTTRYRPSFGNLIGGTINEHHGQKATLHASGFRMLIVHL